MWTILRCVSVCDVVIRAAVFNGVCVCLHVHVCRFSCLYDKWQPDIGLRGRAAQMDYCLCPFFVNITHSTHRNTHISRQDTHHSPSFTKSAPQPMDSACMMCFLVNA